MKIVFTYHAIEKRVELEKFGWKITKIQVKRTLSNPKWHGVSKHGQKTAMGLLNHKHILRVIFDRDNDIIKVITIHVARRGRYESTL